MSEAYENEGYHELLKQTYGHDYNEDPDERLSVVVVSGEHTDEPHSLWETKTEADRVAAELQEDGVGAHVKVLPFWRAR